MPIKEGYGTITLSAAGSVVIRTGFARVNKLINMGAATPTIAIYDTNGTATIAGSLLVYNKAMAGGDNIEINIPCQTGITVTTNSAGTLICTWSKA